jgi:hypothetical protein
MCSKTKMSLAIPKPLLDSLQAAFLAEGRKLCRDAAKVLHKPEKEVLDILKSLPKVSLIIHRDTDDTPTLCPVFLDTRGSLLQRCRRPCILGTGRCFRHQDATEPPSSPENTITLTRIKKTAELDTQLWCCEETNEIYNAEGNIVGELNDQREILIFEYSDV